MKISTNLAEARNLIVSEQWVIVVNKGPNNSKKFAYCEARREKFEIRDMGHTSERKLRPGFTYLLLELRKLLLVMSKNLM